MKNYIKYLLKKPLKLLWLLAMYAFVTTVLIYFQKTKEDIIKDNSKTVYYLLNAFILIIAVVASYQPYKEYKDGISK